MIKTLFLKVLMIGVATIVCILWISGWMSLWISGISAVAYDVEDYRIHSYPIDAEYTVIIDLSDFDSNVGKVLYDDGENQIYVETVLVQDKSDYEVYFRSSGAYSLRGATLVSGTEQAHVSL